MPSSSSAHRLAPHHFSFSSGDRSSAPPTMESRRQTPTSSGRGHPPSTPSNSEQSLDRGSFSHSALPHQLPQQHQQQSHYHHFATNQSSSSAGRYAAEDGVRNLRHYSDMGGENEAVARSSSSFDTDDMAERRIRLRARQEGRFPSTTSFETDGERRRSYARARDEAHAALHDHSSRSTASVSISRYMNSTNTTEQQSSRDRTSRSSKSGEPQHRVYLINCKSCGSFLTDRGMKAVLLLKPHITLYSTDAVPNCGTLCPPSRFSDGTASANEPAVERTCDCLTQTLGCYGCGAAVGYHIVSPCERCTNSVAKHQRSSNGHRTVLHCAEIAVRERRYVPGEPGVRVAPFTWAPAPPSTADRHTPTDITSTPVWRPPLAQHAFSHNRFLSNNRSFDSGGEAFTSTRPPSSDAYMRDYGEEEDDDDDDDELEDCDAEKPESSAMQAAAAAAAASAAVEAQHQREVYEQAIFRHRQQQEYLLQLQQQQDQAHQQQQYQQAVRATSKAKEARRLKRGDVVYWSDLVSGGERCEPIDSDEYLDMPVAGR